MKKFNKTEVKKKLDTIFNTLLCDAEQSESAFLRNEVYSSHSDEFLQLNEAGRALLLEKRINEDHLIKRLSELLNNM